MEKKKIIELDITNGFFGVGFSHPSWKTNEKYIALIIGFLVIRWNL